MTREEIIRSLENQARDKDRLAGGDPESIFARDANVLREAVRLLQKSKWVSVKDKLPEPGGRYLCAFDDGSIATASSTGGDWALWASSVDITHWMPLPEPPEEKNQ